VPHEPVVAEWLFFPHPIHRQGVLLRFSKKTAVTLHLPPPLTAAMGVDAVEPAPLRIVEPHLMASGVPYTILRPNFFMENFSTGFLAPMIKQGGIFLAAADGKTSFISVVDIAEVATVAFQKGLASKEYNLTGPEALDHTMG